MGNIRPEGSVDEREYARYDPHVYVYMCVRGAHLCNLARFHLTAYDGH